jgi:ABC-type transporter Mla subunit MlaD
MDEDCDADDPPPRDLVIAFPDWTVASEESGFLATVVADAAAEAVGQMRTSTDAAEALGLARTLASRLRDRLSGTYLVGAHPETWVLVNHLDVLAAVLAGHSPDLDRYVEQLEYFRDHLRSMADGWKQTGTDEW